MNWDAISLGLDLSLTGTGIVVLEASKDLTKNKLWHKIIHEEEFKTKPMAHRFDRLDTICSRIVSVIEQFNPTVITVENYGVSKMQNGQIEIIELGAVLRAILHARGNQWLDPTPNEMKLFVSGKGNTPKDLIPMHVLSRWGHQSKSNNTADAYVAAAIGLGHSNRLDAMTQFMWEVVGKLKLN